MQACNHIYSETYLQIRSFKLTLLAESAVSQFDSVTTHPDFTKINLLVSELFA